MKHIIYLHPHFTLQWWAGNYILETAKLLAQKKWYKIHIISWKQSKKIIHWLNHINFIETKIPISSSFIFWLFFPLRSIKIIKNIKKIIKQNSWEFVIFGHVFPANWWWWLFKIFNRKHKFVFMCHEPSAFIREKKRIKAINSKSKRIIAKIINPIMRLIDKKLISFADFIISNSEFTSKRTIDIYWRNNDIAYPWYNENVFFPKDIKKEKYFLSVGRLTKFKRVYFIVDSFLQFYKINKDFKLKIIWEWEEYNNLKKYIKENKLENNIQLIWSVDFEKLISYYQKAYATIFASIDEPFGMVPIESMACWTIAVWHNSGWMKETIADEFRYNNQAELINIMWKIANNPIKKFEEINQFTWNETIKVLLKYF